NKRMNSESKISEKTALGIALLEKAHSLLVITGAGISAESGMSTYRGPDGLYEQNPEIPLVLSAEGLANEPHKLWKHIDALRIQAAAAEPNPAHKILAQWEQEHRFERLLVATQNIDGLHQKAGSERVTELHGSLWQMARPRTIDYTEDDQFSDDAQDWMSSRNRESILHRWSQENNQTVWENREVPFETIPPSRDPEVRPNVLFFNESYGTRLLWVNDFIQKTTDVVLVIGCSGEVAILDRLLRYCLEANPDCSIININPHEDCVQQTHLYIQQAATDALVALNSQLTAL
ncbi:MAG: Sir2 family NAD-dependent protein deacetylase, partial [Kiritimatiellales bacterium]